jgi:hypothetical protein
MSRRALTVWLLIIGSVGEFTSDLALRATGLDGTHGINAHSYNVTFSLVLGTAMFMMITSYFGGDS